MLKYCPKVENNPEERAAYAKTFEDIKDWYIQQHKEVEHMLQNDMIAQLYKKVTESDERSKTLNASMLLNGLSGNFQALLSLYSVADMLCLQILAKYTAGPADLKDVVVSESKASWRNTKLNVMDLHELVQHQMEAHGQGGRINLMALNEDRSVRSNLTHKGKIAACLSAIRCYNILREMMILMDPEIASQLPRFSYPRETGCDIQQFLNHTNQLDFKNENTMLVVGSLHDIPAEGKRLLANMPWTLVLDMDGCSDHGGLRSCLQHSCVQRQKLTDKTAQRHSILKDYTSWFTCGDFTEYSYDNWSNNRVYFPTKSCFYPNPQTQSLDMRNMLSGLLQTLAHQLKPLNVVFLHDDIWQARMILELCHAMFGPDRYRFTAVYYTAEEEWSSIRGNADRRGRSVDYAMESITCDLDSFFEGLQAYSNLFPSRADQRQGRCLPSEDGSKEMSSNIVQNLAQYFEVLYDDVGMEEPEKAEALVSEFYHGGRVPWCAFRRGQAVQLKLEGEYNKDLTKLRRYLQSMSERKVVQLLHEPGIGGSTLLRQIGWDLHLEYPTLVVHKYDPKIRERIMQLYDEVRKGVLILADESVSELDRLKEDVMTIPRACVLVVAERLRQSSNQRYDSNAIIDLRGITGNAEERLREHFKRYSQLSAMDKSLKDRDYMDIIGANPSLRCPFMIGLYYLEKDFMGVEDYVDRALAGPKETYELEIMAIIALCGCYGKTGLPEALVKEFMGIGPREEYLQKFPYAAPLFIRFSNPNDVPAYKVKHEIIGQVLLEKCCQKLYGSGLKNNLSALAERCIDVVCDICKRGYSPAYQDVMERLFIEQMDGEFSPLIMAITEPLSRKFVLEKLAKRMEELAEQINELCRMAAHSYGHLGRLCSRPDGGLENGDDAKRFSRKAVDLMEASQTEDPDPSIYHMYGEVCKHDLQNQWEATETMPEPEDFARYEEQIRLAEEMFDKAAEYGEESFAVASKLGMLIRYLRDFVYRWKGVNTVRDITKLSPVQAGYRAEIENLLQQMDSMKLKDRELEMLRRFENEYNANVMLNDYGTAISYYENLLTTLQTGTGHDMEKQLARRGLISARMSRFETKAKASPDEHVEMDVKELRTVLDLLEQSIAQPIDPNNYRERTNRMICYNRWFRLAKMQGAGRSMHTADRYARRWDELATQSHMDDPRPVYYRFVLGVLQQLDGNQGSSSECREQQKRCYELARSKGFSTEWIHDVLVEGAGLERLLDMRYAKNPLNYLEKAKRRPLVVEGEFVEISGNKGVVRLQKPVNWAGLRMKFVMGEEDRSNTVGRQQLTHRLAAMVGFSMEQIAALNHMVRDLTEQESYPSLEDYKKKTQRNQAPKPAVKSAPKEQVPPELVGRRGLFTVQKVSPNGGLAGTVELDGLQLPGTLSRQLVTDRMRQQAESGQMQMEVELDKVAPLGDRYLVKPL